MMNKGMTYIREVLMNYLQRNNFKALDEFGLTLNSELSGAKPLGWRLNQGIIIDRSISCRLDIGIPSLDKDTLTVIYLYQIECKNGVTDWVEEKRVCTWVREKQNRC